MAAVENGHTTRAKKRANPRSEAVYFLSLQLCNARCFGDQPQTLDLSDGAGKPARWTILLGNNGTGKTTILQSLVGFERTLSLGDEQAKYPRAFDRRLNGYWDGFIRFRKRSSSLMAKVARGSGMAVGSGDFEGKSLNMSIKRDGSIMMSSEEDYSIKAAILKTPSPLCFAYGAGRRLGRSSLVASETDDPAMSLFLEDFELLNAEEWLLRLDYSASKPSDIQKRQQTRLDQVKELLVNILPDVTDIQIVSPTKKRPDPAVEFKTPYGWVKLGHLGYGYRTLIAWMVDFASRMVDRYPDSSDPLAEPAVVLVDEIDLHLHPTWQRTLIGYLTERFPNTQFIVTAHSPLIVQAASGIGANIAVLRRQGDHVIIENDKDLIRGWRVDQILTSDLFGLESARPPDLDQPLSRRRELLSKPKLTKQDQAELSRLEEQIGTLPVGETDAQARKMLDLVEETQRLLRKREDKPK